MLGFALGNIIIWEFLYVIAFLLTFAIIGVLFLIFYHEDLKKINFK